MTPRPTQRPSFPDPNKEPQLTLAPPSSPASEEETNGITNEVSVEAIHNNDSRNGQNLDSGVGEHDNDDDENGADDDVDLDFSTSSGRTPQVQEAELAPDFDIEVNRIVAETRSNVRGIVQGQVAQVTRTQRDQAQDLPLEVDQMRNNVILATVVVNETGVDDNTTLHRTDDDWIGPDRGNFVYQEKNRCWSIFLATVVCLVPIAVMVGIAVVLSIALSEPTNEFDQATTVPASPAPTSIQNANTKKTKAPQPTTTPTISLSPTKGDYWLQLLADELKLEDPDALPENSAERMGFEWMANNDTLRNELLVSSTNSTTGNRILLERYAVVVLYFSTNGLSWSNQVTFLSSSSVCSWNDGATVGIFCNHREEVKSIELNGNNLNGTIPFQLGELVSLTQIDMSNNLLMGTIPPSVGNWTNMNEVRIHDNQLTGTIPDSVVSWGEIRHFDASHNGIGGLLSESLSAWTNIESIAMDRNSLTGTIPDSISSWTQLQQFDLSDNSLTGGIPDSLASWTLLQYFDVSSNPLGGTIPSTVVASWTEIRHFYVRSNELVGTLPEEFGSLSILSAVALQHNVITGDIDALFCRDQGGPLVQADCREPNPDIICTCCECF